MEEKLYSDQEAEQILHRAARGMTGGVSQQRLLEMGAELGISPADVEAAAAQVREEELEKTERREYNIRQRRSFLSTLLTSTMTSLFFVGINLFTSHRVDWAWWLVGFSAIAVLNQAKETFAKGSEDYEKSFRKWRVKRRAGDSVGYEMPTVGIHFDPGKQTTDSRAPADLLGVVETEVLRDNLTKLEAIKRVREETGASLADAKLAVEEFNRANPGVLKA